MRRTILTLGGLLGALLALSGAAAQPVTLAPGQSWTLTLRGLPNVTDLSLTFTGTSAGKLTGTGVLQPGNVSLSAEGIGGAVARLGLIRPDGTGVSCAFTNAVLTGGKVSGGAVLLRGKNGIDVRQMNSVTCEGTLTTAAAAPSTPTPRPTPAPQPATPTAPTAPTTQPAAPTQPSVTQPSVQPSPAATVRPRTAQPGALPPGLRANPAVRSAFPPRAGQTWRLSIPGVDTVEMTLGSFSIRPIGAGAFSLTEGLSGTYARAGLESVEQEAWTGINVVDPVQRFFVWYGPYQGGEGNFICGFAPNARAGSTGGITSSSARILTANVLQPVILSQPCTATLLDDPAQAASVPVPAATLQPPLPQKGDVWRVVQQGAGAARTEVVVSLNGADTTPPTAGLVQGLTRGLPRAPSEAAVVNGAVAFLYRAPATPNEILQNNGEFPTLACVFPADRTLSGATLSGGVVVRDEQRTGQTCTATLLDRVK